jgi:hypothetical protein
VRRVALVEVLTVRRLLARRGHASSSADVVRLRRYDGVAQRFASYRPTARR